MLTSLTSVIAAAPAENATPQPVALGLTAAGILLLLLIIATRFNKDR